MANVRRTAMGDAVDMDMLRLANEQTIAIGNMKVNARGDQLGPGGKIIKTRAQVMQEYHKLNTNFAQHEPPPEDEMIVAPAQAPTNVVQPVAATEPPESTPAVEETAQPGYVKPRGSFAGAVAEQTEITQELLTPPTKNKGIQRI